MIDIKLLQKSEYFKKRVLKSWEYLFLEWDFDSNIYIILNWELNIEKYIDNKKIDSKNLAILKKSEVFWEASLNSNSKKQVSIKAKIETELLYIEAGNLEKFAKNNSKQAFNLLKYIIHLSNNRLNISNNLITSSHKISSSIINIKDFKNKTIFELIENIKETIEVSEIIFLEENPVLKQYLTVKYKTTEKWKMQDKIIKITENRLDLSSLKTYEKYNFIQSLRIWDRNYWYLIFIRDEEDFTENEIKIFWIMSTSLAWVLKQKEFIKEQADKISMKNY